MIAGQSSNRARPAALDGWTAAFTLLVLLGGSAGCRRAPSGGGDPTLAVTTSYLEAAARDLLGEDLRVLRLAEPGTCPGHFDIRPSQAEALRRCRALVRFDFQSSLEARLSDSGTNGPRAAAITLSGGMGRPDNYLTACTQLAGHLMPLDLLDERDALRRIEAIAERLAALTVDLTNRVAEAGLNGTPVLASTHQRDFVQWLGLEVVATFRAADTASVSEIEDAISAGKLAGIRFVIANLPEGRRTADALADRLKARVVVFENFPALVNGRVSFDQMITANVEALVQATRE